MSQLKTGALLSYVKIFLTNIGGLVITPFIIKSLGNAEYGLYTLIGSLVGSISVLDLGLSNSVVRFVAKYRVEKDKKGEENFLAMILGTYAVISLMIVLIGIVFYFNLDTAFSNSLNSEELAKAKVMFAILIFNLAISLPAGTFSGICTGYEHFIYPRAVSIIRFIVRSGLVVGLLLLGGDAIGLVVLDTIVNILAILVHVWYVNKKLKVSFKLHKYQIKLVKEIFSYSIWVFVLALTSQLQWRGGQIILGMYTNTTIVAVYAVGIILGTYYGSFSTGISSVFLPRATKMIYSNAKGEELTLMMIKIGRISLLVLLLVLGGFILFGRQFIFLWVGEAYEDAWYIALIVMFAFTPVLIQSFANLILDARALFAFKGFVYIICLVLGTLIGALFLKGYGSIAIVMGTSIGWVIAQIIMNFYFKRVINLNIPLFFRKTLSRILPAFIFIMFIGFFTTYIPGVGWLNFIIKSILYSTTYLSIMYSFGMLVEEKNIIKSFLPFKKNNLKNEN